MNRNATVESGMQNETEEAYDSPSWVRIIAVGLTLLTVLFYAAMYPLAAQFEELFASFGGSLPGATLFALDAYPFFGLLAFVSIVPCTVLFAQPKTSKKNDMSLFGLVVTGCVTAFLVFGLFISAMYLPIFRLGSAVL